MGMYMYPIKINRELEIVRYDKVFDLEELELSLDQLKQYVSNDETFTIDNDNYKIYVYGKRFETNEEFEARVAKEEQYMINYTKFHNNGNT